MNELQKLALKQALVELEEAYTVILMKAQTPEFGDPCNRSSKSYEAHQRIQKARTWMQAALDA